MRQVGQVHTLATPILSHFPEIKTVRMRITPRVVSQTSLPALPTPARVSGTNRTRKMRGNQMGKRSRIEKVFSPKMRFPTPTSSTTSPRLQQVRPHLPDQLTTSSFPDLTGGEKNAPQKRKRGTRFSRFLLLILLRYCKRIVTCNKSYSASPNRRQRPPSFTSPAPLHSTVSTLAKVNTFLPRSSVLVLTGRRLSEPVSTSTFVYSSHPTFPTGTDRPQPLIHPVLFLSPGFLHPSLSLSPV